MTSALRALPVLAAPAFFAADFAGDLVADLVDVFAAVFAAVLRAGVGVFLVAIAQWTVRWSPDAPSPTRPAPSRRARRSSSAIRPSIWSIARSITRSSSWALNAPEPLNASRCPQASGANRPRSWGP